MRLDVSVPANACANVGRFVAKKNPIAGRTALSLQDRPECARLRGDSGQQAGSNAMASLMLVTMRAPRAVSRAGVRGRVDKLVSPAGKRPAGAQPVHQPVHTAGALDYAREAPLPLTS